MGIHGGHEAKPLLGHKGTPIELLRVLHIAGHALCARAVLIGKNATFPNPGWQSDNDPVFVPPSFLPSLPAVTAAGKECVCGSGTPTSSIKKRNALHFP